MRTEHDALGSLDLADGVLHGIHTERSRRTFALAGRSVHPELIRAFGVVKLACLEANREIGMLTGERADRLAEACREMMAGALDPLIVVDALQGGAGTSTNLNVNEVLANRACVLAGRPPGDHAFCDPLDHANLHQSTNDTYPTALRVAALRLLDRVEAGLVACLGQFQRLEQAFAGLVKIGRTELQDAVPTTLGRSMGAYAEVIGRDRWRLAKCRERLRVVNLGGTAIGTGLGAPRRYIFAATEHLRRLAGLPLARAENLVDGTANADAFAEVAGILGALAADLVKVADDLRLLASGPQGGLGELVLPARQEGSSIMPGKINPVIPEAVVQAGLAWMGDQQVIVQACARGCLELNPYLPLVADRLLHGIDVLARACLALATKCLDGVQVDAARCAAHASAITAQATAIAGKLGHARAGELARQAQATGRTVRDLAVDAGLLTAAEFDGLTSPAAVMRLGGVP